MSILMILTVASYLLNLAMGLIGILIILFCLMALLYCHWTKTSKTTLKQGLLITILTFLPVIPLSLALKAIEYVNNTILGVACGTGLLLGLFSMVKVRLLLREFCDGKEKGKRYVVFRTVVWGTLIFIFLMLLITFILFLYASFWAN